MFDDLCAAGKADFVLDGQWGSAGKGACVAHLTKRLCEQDRMYDIVATNNGAQSGHTSIHNGKVRVAFHIPTAPLIAVEYGHKPAIYLNAGSIVDPVVLWREIEELGVDTGRLFIHPNAAIITDSCKLAEMNKDSAQTKIASTRKGVGEALARKALRYGLIAKDYAPFAPFIKRLDLNDLMACEGRSVLVEVPQGISLSVNGPFYPHCTSRDSTVMQAMSDAGIHPHIYGAAMLVIRCYPIRVGSIVDEGGKVLGESGGCYSDQQEISWNRLGVKPEITTVTKRVRRVFTFSERQLHDAMALTRPAYVQLTFCDYPGADLERITRAIHESAASIGMDKPTILYQYGPSTDDVSTELR